MTRQEFWKLKVGDFVIDDLRKRLMKITKRTFENEVVGLIISKTHTEKIQNGRKYVQLTLEDMHGNTFYYDSNRYDLKYLRRL